MKILMVGDLHVDPYHQFSFDEEFEGEILPSRTVDCIRVIRKANKLAKEYDAQVVYMGDIFHDRYTIDISIADRISREIGRDAYVVRGNHDSYDNDGRVSSTKLLFEGSISRCTFKKREGVGLYFCPYYDSPYPELKKLIKKHPLGKQKQNYVFAHLHPDGAKLSGIELSNKTCPAAAKFLRPFDGCFTGHIHIPQQIGCWDIVGASLQTNFGELNFDPQFYLLDTTDCDINIIPTEAPLFRADECRSLKQLKALHESVVTNPAQYIRLRVPAAAYNRYRLTISKIQDKARGCRVEVQDDLGVVGNNEKTNLNDLEGLVASYVEDEGVDNKKLTLQVGLGIVKELEHERARGSRLRLQSVEIKDFLSVGSAKIVLRKLDGVTQLKGANGTGKSALIEAIFYALTGTTLRGSRAARVIRHGRKDCKVVLRFVWKKSSYHITRRRRSGKGSVSFYKEGKAIPLSGNVDRQTRTILSTLGISLDLLTHTSFLTTKTQPLSRLTDGAKKQVLVDSLLGAKVISTARKKARAGVAKYKSLLDKASSALREVVSTVKQTSKAVKKGEADFKTRLAEYKKARKGYDDVQFKMMKKTKALKKERKEVDRIKAKVQVVTLRVGSWTNKLLKQQELISDMADRRSIKCPNCKTMIVGMKAVGAREEVKEKIEYYQSNLRKARSKLNKLQTWEGKLQATVNSTFDEFSRLTNISKPVKPVKGVISDLKKVLTSKKKRKKELDEKIERCTRFDTAYRFWDKAFSDKGLRTRILYESVQFINERLRGVSELGDLDANLYFSSTGKIEIALKSPTGAETYEECSDGQQARFDLAMMQAMNALADQRKVSIPDMIFLDERFPYIDGQGQRALVQQLKKSGRRSFVVSREPAITTVVDHVINVSLVKNRTVYRNA